MTTAWAKARRKARLRAASGAYVWLAFDHGLTFGALPDIVDIAELMKLTSDSGISGVVLNKGLVEQLPHAATAGLILQTFGLPQFPGAHSQKVRVATINEAIRAAADAVAAELNMNATGFPAMVAEVARLGDDASAVGLPLLVMATPRNDVEPHVAVADALRVSTEMGADFIKIGLSENVLGCDASQLRLVRRVAENAPPVLLAGGPSNSDFSYKLILAQRLSFSGVCVGRHLFQSANAESTLEKIQSAFAGGG
ncbi:hypothetical protein [Micromonospora sp. NPDC049891]|uniref:hypothetical protein n=1 Tax=Micromonospora sp. NPDC049891 TaxID=3155655 RepID=UPI003403F70E